MQRELRQVSASLKALKADASARNVANDIKKMGYEASSATGIVRKLIGTFQGLGALRLFGAIGALYALRQALLGVKTAMITAAEFEKSISNINTLYDDAGQSVAALEKGIKQLVKTLPISPNELGSAAYQIVSAGITDTAEAMKVLEASGKLAVAGLATTAESADILTSAVNTFRMEGLEANQIADILFKTVKSGKTTIAELAQSFGATAPTVAEAGVKLADFQAATAALTTTGLPASQAQQSLRQAIAGLLKPTSEMQKLFEVINVKDGRELIATSENLQEVFAKLRDASISNNLSLEEAVGSVESLTAVYGLTGSVADAYASTLDQLAGGTQKLDQAFLKQQGTMSAQWMLVKNQLNVAMADLGARVFPLVIDAVNKAISIIESFIRAYKESEQFIKRVLIPTIVLLVAQFAALKVAMSIIGVVNALQGGFIGLKAALAIGAAIKAVTLQLAALRTAFGLLAGPIGIIIGLLTAVGVAAWNAYKDIQKTEVAIKESFDKSKSYVADFENSYTDKMAKAEKANSGLVKSLQATEADIALINAKLSEQQSVTTNSGFFGLIDQTETFDKYQGEARQNLINLKKQLQDQAVNLRKQIENDADAKIDLAKVLGIGGGNNVPEFKLPKFDFPVIDFDKEDTTKKTEQMVDSLLNIVSRLGDGLNNLREKYDDIKKSGKEAISQITDASKQKLQNLNSQISDIRDNIAKLDAEFARQRGSDRQGLAESFIAAEESVKSLKEELIRATDAQDILDIKSQIADQESALNATKDTQTQFAKEIAEAKRRASLSQLERDIEDFNTRRQLAQDEYNENKNVLLQRLSDLKNEREEEKKLAEQKIAEAKSVTDQKLKELQREKVALLQKNVQELVAEFDKSAAIKQLIKQAQDFRVNATQNAFNAIKNDVEKEIELYEKLARAIEKAADARSSGKARSSRDTGGTIQQTGLYRLHQGEEVLTRREAGGGVGGGVNVYITGGTYLSEDAAEQIGDLLIDRLQAQFRV